VDQTIHHKVHQIDQMDLMREEELGKPIMDFFCLAEKKILKRHGITLIY
jgi:hypothetical protein